MDDVSEETRRLAQHIAHGRELKLPDEVLERAKLHLLDAIGAVVSGSAMPAGVAARAWLDVAYGNAPGPATVLGTRRRAAVVPAALVNGMAGHADETDDSHAPSLSHPGCSVGPTVLAVGEAQGASGADVLRAFVVGYDVGCRIGRAVGSAHRDRSVGTWSSHAVVGTFCSAAAAGVLYDLDDDAARYLLSYAAHLASGVTSWVRDTHHIEKAFIFAGMPASQGVLAASLVASGCDGLDDEFSGSPSWLQAASANPDRSQLAEGLGERFEVMQATIKKYSVGSPSQAAVEGIVEFLAEGLRAEDVASITVTLPGESAVVVDNRAMPNVNVQYLVAGTLLDGAFSLKMSHDEERFADPEVRALMGRIALEGDPAIAQTRSARLAVTRRDGGPQLEKTVRDVRGTPGNPMSVAEVRTKTLDLLGDVLGAARSAAVCDLVEHLDEVDDIHELTALLASEA
jgi:2-methylcitrate dehydratase PrpD